MLAAAAAPCADAPRNLTWEGCVKTAKAGNSILNQARFRLDAARADRNAALGSFLPRVSGSVSASDSGTEPAFSGYDPGYGASLSASQSLFSGFSTASDVVRNYASVRKEKARLRRDEAAVRESLRKAFLNLLYSQEYVVLLEDIARRRADNADLVRLRYEAGREDKGSSMRVAADARQAAYDVTRARRALNLAQHQLLGEMGLDEFGYVKVAGDWTSTPPPEPGDLRDLAANLPSVVEAEASLTETKASFTSALSPFFPSVDASAGLSRDGEVWPPTDRGWSAGVSLSYNFFNGGRDAFKALAARAQLKSAREGLSAARRDARIALEDALNSYLDAFEALEVRKLYLEATKERAQIGRAQYGNGLLDFTQWDIIESELVGSEQGFLRARRDALYAQAAWRRVLGEGFEQ